MPVTGEQAIQHATEAYQTRDLSLCDLADLDEQAIDPLEREIDEVLLCPWLTN